jgi:CBS domain-containing protein
MNEKVSYCWPETSLAAAAVRMWDEDCGALPVVIDGGRVIGMITDRDIAIAAGTKGRPAFNIPVREVMSQALYACSTDDDVHTALKTMRKEKVRRLPVIDGDGVLKGILSMNNIVLLAQKGEKKHPSELDYEDVVNTYKAICEHRHLPKPEEEHKLLAAHV